MRVIDPATSTRAFVLAMTDIGEIYFLPPLMELLARIAPEVSISTVRNAIANLKKTWRPAVSILRLDKSPI